MSHVLIQLPLVTTKTIVLNVKVQEVMNTFDYCLMYVSSLQHHITSIAVRVRYGKRPLDIDTIFVIFNVFNELGKELEIKAKVVFSLSFLTQLF